MSFGPLYPLEYLRIDSYGSQPLCKLENILRVLRWNKRCNSPEKNLVVIGRMGNGVVCNRDILGKEYL